MNRPLPVKNQLTPRKCHKEIFSIEKMALWGSDDVITVRNSFFAHFVVIFTILKAHYITITVVNPCTCFLETATFVE